MPLLRLLPSDDRTLFGECGNVVLAFSTHQETPETFHLAQTHFQGALARHPQGIAFLFLVDHTEGPPPGFIERARAVLATVETRMQGISVVLLTQGFAAAIYRATAATFITLTGKRSLIHVDSTIEGGARWLCERLGTVPSAPDPSSLADACTALVAQRRVAEPPSAPREG